MTLPVIQKVMEHAPLPAVELSCRWRSMPAADNWDEAH